MKKTLYIIAIVILLIGCTGQNEKRNSQKTKDEVAPFINLSVFEFDTKVGHPIDFTNITGYDDVDGLLSTYLKGNVDYDKVGSYHPLLCCKDEAGNESSVVLNINVLEDKDMPLDESEVIMDPKQENLENTSPCDKWNAKDKNIPCSVVNPDSLKEYRVVFTGVDHFTDCEKNTNKGEECVLIKTNDGTPFGYGIKEK